MEIKRTVILLIFSMLILVGLMFYLLVYQQAKIQGMAISNESGSGSCLIHNGFTWNQTEQACVREWVPVGVAGRYQKYFNLSNSNFTSNQTVLNYTTKLNVTEINSTNETNSTQDYSNKTWGSIISKVIS